MARRCDQCKTEASVDNNNVGRDTWRQWLSPNEHAKLRLSSKRSSVLLPSTSGSARHLSDKVVGGFEGVAEAMGEADKC